MQSTGRTGARLLLLAVIGLSLSTVWFSVRINTWNGAFFNAIQAMDGGTIYPLLLEFIAIVAAFVFVLVYADWLRKKLVIEWRRWMTEDLLGRWLSVDGRHYRLQLAGLEPDNPDQRIAEDVRLLIESSLTLVISFRARLLTIVSFVTILWTLSGTLEWTDVRHRVGASRLHGLDLHRLHARRDGAHARDRPSPDEAQLRAAEAGGRLQHLALRHPPPRRVDCGLGAEEAEQARLGFVRAHCRQLGARS